MLNASVNEESTPRDNVTALVTFALAEYIHISKERSIQTK